jgi:hypothetical protein
MYCNDCSELIQHCRCSWFGGRHLLASLVAATALVAGCSSDADVASHNLSKAADQFEVTRRIVFYNGITGGYMLTIEGLCSLGNNDKSKTLSVTCKTGPAAYNVTFFVEQLEPVTASPYRYRVIFKPDVIVPDINFSAAAPT